MNKILDSIRKVVRPNPPVKNLIDLVYGHTNTQKTGQSIAKNGEPIPWYTYPAIEFLDQFNLKDKSVFEWGCGNSSLYYSKRVKNITSVEHDESWFNLVSKSIQRNQKLVYEPLDKYPSSIRNYSEKYDIIVIDGQRRFDCVQECKNYLNSGGLIILDNSDWFYVSAAFLRLELELLQVDFHGFGPINDYTWTTSFFFSPEFSFPLLNSRQPKNPKGGVEHNESDIIKSEDQKFNTSNQRFLVELT